MTTPDLKSLSDAATQGEWACKPFGSVKALRSMGSTLAHFFIGDKKKAKEDASYIAAIVNAHRAGEIVTAAERDAAVLEENEACAGVVESLWAHRTCREVADAIRARTTQEGET